MANPFIDARNVVMSANMPSVRAEPVKVTAGGSKKKTNVTVSSATGAATRRTRRIATQDTVDSLVADLRKVDNTLAKVNAHQSELLADLAQADIVVGRKLDEVEKKAEEAGRKSTDIIVRSINAIRAAMPASARAKISKVDSRQATAADFASMLADLYAYAFGTQDALQAEVRGIFTKIHATTAKLAGVAMKADEGVSAAAQIVDLKKDLIASGIFPAGTFMEQLATKAVHINGVRIDLGTLFASLGLMRMTKLYAPVPKSTTLLSPTTLTSRLMHTTPPLRMQQVAVLAAGETFESLGKIDSVAIERPLYGLLIGAAGTSSLLSAADLANVIAGTYVTGAGDTLVFVYDVDPQPGVDLNKWMQAVLPVGLLSAGKSWTTVLASIPNTLLSLIGMSDAPDASL